MVHSRAEATTLQWLRNTRVEYLRKPQETRSAAPQQHLLTLLQPSSTRAHNLGTPKLHPLLQTQHSTGFTTQNYQETALGTKKHNGNDQDTPMAVSGCQLWYRQAAEWIEHHQQ